MFMSRQRKQKSLIMNYRCDNNSAFSMLPTQSKQESDSLVASIEQTIVRSKLHGGGPQERKKSRGKKSLKLSELGGEIGAKVRRIREVTKSKENVKSLSMLSADFYQYKKQANYFNTDKMSLSVLK